MFQKRSKGRTILFVTCISIALATGCMKWEYDLDTDFDVVPEPGKGVFISNEGNFQYGNASLTYYDTSTGKVENDIFIRANGQKLGDVAQSMTLHNGTLWVIVNNSHVVFAVDPYTFREKGRITGFTSPRYMHFVSDDKAYVTQLWDSRIFIVNPRTYSITGYIETGMDNVSGSTEQMVGYGKYVITNCWAYQNRILTIDTTTDMVTGSLEVGLQPSDITMDSEDKLWVITDGGYEGNPAGCEYPTLKRIDPETMNIEKSFIFFGNDRPYSLSTNIARDSIFFICGGVWKMAVEDSSLPSSPFIESKNTKYYSLSVCPFNSEIYLSDAIDWQQKGIIYRYSPSGHLIGEFRAGITPGDFCWFTDTQE